MQKDAVSKPRFVELSKGQCRVFATKAPVKIELGETTHFRADSHGNDSEVQVDAGGLKMTVGRSGARTLYEWAMERNGLEWRRMLLRAKDESGDEVVLLLSGRAAFMFKKKPKWVFALSGVTLDTSEHRQMEYRLSCTTSRPGNDFVISLPEPLLLLRWIAALNSCDAAHDPQEKSVSSVADKVVLQELRATHASMHQNRKATLGINKALDIRDDEEPEMYTREEIRKEMLEASSFPVKIPSTRDILNDASMRMWAYKWSVTQYSSENVKFYVACDNLSHLTDEAEKATVLKRIIDEFVSADGDNVVNISGSQRKRVLASIVGKSDVELAAIAMTVLEEVLQEIVRVMEFDIFTGLSSLSLLRAPVRCAC
jgi:hypothetical protein